MADGTLGFGIVGSGFMGQTYAKTLGTMVDGARLVGVTGGSRAAQLAETYGVTRFDSYEALLASDEIDAVCIATPHACHGPQALAAAQAGKHVQIDKPMATSVEACDVILDACDERGLKCAVTFTLRGRIGFVRAKETIDSGRLGRVREIRTYQIVPGGLGAVPKWQLEPENIGLLFGHGIHNIDAVRTLTGREIRSVFAKCRTMTGAPVEATSDVILTMDDGSVHYVFCSFEVPKPGFPRSEVGARIVCERGLVDLDPYAETRASIDGGPWETIAVQPSIDWAGQGFLDPNRLESYRHVLDDLVDAIRNDREPRASGRDGRQAVAAVFAAYESSRTGREIGLTD
ncbi:MAG TPA: Gfo/Idh/MocA family oxidoreductase [Candidatus Hydrogenedentes bacterium]|nr:Gfo/Idh/MocA family oxidoreductase [Candidatus Hydrogenedentota bacterium]HPG67661.1 Gfo/Idh/MocA family oxidoreductase [Candidatus Hydrogenedentota bacterium]